MVVGIYLSRLAVVESNDEVDLVWNNILLPAAVLSDRGAPQSKNAPSQFREQIDSAIRMHDVS